MWRNFGLPLRVTIKGKITEVHHRKCVCRSGPFVGQEPSLRRRLSKTLTFTYYPLRKKTLPYNPYLCTRLHQRHLPLLLEPPKIWCLWQSVAANAPPSLDGLVKELPPRTIALCGVSGRGLTTVLNTFAEHVCHFQHRVTVFLTLSWNAQRMLGDHMKAMQFFERLHFLNRLDSHRSKMKEKDVYFFSDLVKHQAKSYRMLKDAERWYLDGPDRKPTLLVWTEMNC